MRSSPLLASAPAPFREAVDKAARKAGLEGAEMTHARQMPAAPVVPCAACARPIAWARM